MIIIHLDVGIEPRSSHLTLQAVRGKRSMFLHCKAGERKKVSGEASQHAYLWRSRGVDRLSAFLAVPSRLVSEINEFLITTQQNGREARLLDDGVLNYHANC